MSVSESFQQEKLSKVAVTSIKYRYTPEDIKIFTSRPALAAASRASYLRVLKTFFRWCLKSRYVETDPTAHLTAPRQSKKRIAFFTRSELDRFCEAGRCYYQRRKTVMGARQSASQTGAR